MTKRERYRCCMTLRLADEMEDDLDTFAHDLQRSKADTIRLILGRALCEANQKKRSRSKDENQEPILR